MADPKKKCPECEEGAPAWLATYGDMVTLLMCFFVILMNPEAIDGARLELILASFTGLGPLEGGNTLEVGNLVELGNSVMTLPSQAKGRGLDKARKSANSLFATEVKTKQVMIKEDERGLIISLAGDSFFRPASAEIDIERSRETLKKAADLLSSSFLSDRKFRIEGHTDSGVPDPNGLWPSNWELASARSNNVLKYLVEFGSTEHQFSTASFSDTMPVDLSGTPEGDAYNRRVEIVVLADGHL
ncbi:MAG: flagellar motor protein MotB [Spirochaetaceae bacterium]